MSVRSKLPDVGTTVFTVMSRRAAETGAINLGQGFPDYPLDPRLTELVTQAMEQGHNQYAPMAGLAALREQIARKLQRCYAVAVDPETEITVTVGATEALFSSIQALVGAGDEVIIFDPAYDSYDPAVRLAGARCVHLPLAPPHFRPDWERVRAALTARTRLIIINSPHNPACSCLRIWTSWRRCCAAVSAWCWPMKSMSTWCLTAPRMPRCWATLNCARAALPFTPSARPCIPPGCASAMPWRRRH
jgi:methionine aminotransferase